MKTIIQTPTSNLKKSLDFYSRLGFQVIQEENPTLVADDQLIIEINPDRMARAGIKLINFEKSILSRLKDLATVYEMENGHVIQDPSGTYVYLMEEFPLPQLSTKTRAISGNFSGISIETGEMKRSLLLYQTLGFKEVVGSAEQGWMSLQNENKMIISLMAPLSCPHLFINPSLTFFNGPQNMEVINNVRDAGIAITEEITCFNENGIVDNIIISDPGGMGMFLFND